MSNRIDHLRPRTTWTGYLAATALGVMGAVAVSGSPVEASSNPPLGIDEPVCFESGAVSGESVIVNVTPVDAVAVGFGTLTVSGEDWRATSSVNFGVGGANPNVTVKAPGADGLLCYTADQPSHVVVDVVAYAGFESRPGDAGGGASRMLDTRTGPLDDRAVAFFRSLERICADYRQSQPDDAAEVRPQRFDSVVSLGAVSPTEVRVVDGTGHTYLVDFASVDSVYPKASPPVLRVDEFMPTDIVWGCPPEMWTGGLDV